MDRNSVTGIILMTLLTLGYFYFFPPTPPEPSQPTATVATDSVGDTPDTADQPVQDDPSVAVLDGVETDSAREAGLRDKYSDMWRLVNGEEETVQIITDKLTVELNTKGGTFEAVYLNEHKTFDSLPLPVLAPNPENEFFFEFAYKNRAMRTDELFFTPSVKSLTVNGADAQEVVMRADVGEGKFIEQVYTFTGDKYDVGYKVRMQGLGEGLGKASYYDFQWKSFLPKTELSLKNMRQKTSIAYRIGDDVEKMSPSDETEKEKLGALVKWVSFKSQFFSQILISDQTFRSGSVTMRTPTSEEINRVMEAKLVVDVKDQDNIDNDFRIYFGPNEYTTLNSYDLELEEEMDLGWWLIGWINKGTTYVFKFMERYISNYGLIIILLAVFIRLLMLPLSYKSYISMAKMRIINGTPELKALDAKYKDDPQKLQMAKMAIYKEMGASMFGGCLPMLLSYPFLIALFFFFPQSVELRQQSFLWAHDLSTYDAIFTWTTQIPIISSLYGNHISLFTILMAASTFVYTYFQQQSQPSAGANQFKYIAYFMPLFLMVFLNNYASGLSLYYLVSNLIQITQTTVIRYGIVNDEKLLAQMREVQKQAKKNKGKKGGGKGKGGNAGGGGQKSRLEKWMEKQQARQQEMMKERQKGQGPQNRRNRRSK